MNDGLNAELRGVFVDRSTATAVILLGEAYPTDRVLPIFIRSVEAEVIGIGLVDMAVPRPLTHDLLINTIEALDARLRRVTVVGLDHGTFLAEIEIETDGGRIRIDARPGDCVALAVRKGLPIGVDRKLFERLAIDVMQPEHESFDDDIERIIGDFRQFLDDADPDDFSGTDPPGR